jgi:predicted transcriptional regulator
MKVKRAVLRVEATKKSFDDLFGAMKSKTRKDKGQFVICFPDFATLGKVLTGNRLQILAAIRSHKPNSIQELARVLKRDFKNVYQDVKFLADFGLVQLSSAGARKPAVPKAVYQEIVLAA